MKYWIVGIVIALVAAIVVIASTLALMYVDTSNKEVSLRNYASAQEKVNETVYDKTWKIIQQKAGVSSQYANDFKKVYVDLMSKRYEGKDPMMNWIQEQNPTFDISLYKDLSASIEALRTEFQNVQAKLIDIQREHNNLRTQIPSCWFVGGRPALDIKIVTSSKTEEAFSTGKEDSVKLFN